MKADKLKKNLKKKAKNVEKDLKKGIDKIAPGKKKAGPGKKVAAAAAVAAVGALGVAALRARSGDRRLDFRVVPNGDEGWAVKSDGTDKPLGVFGSKRAAVSAGRKAARSAAPSTLYIHGQDGQVLKSHSYEA